MGYRPGQFINLPYFNKTERRALNIDGTEFSFEQFIPLVESNLVDPDELNKITEGIDTSDLRRELTMNLKMVLLV